MIIYTAFIMGIAIPFREQPPTPLSFFWYFIPFKHTVLCDLFSLTSSLLFKGICHARHLTSCYQQIFALLKSPDQSPYVSHSVSHNHCGLVRNESLNVRTRQTGEGKEIFNAKVGVRYRKVCLTGRESTREWQIRPPGSPSLHLLADNASLPITVHELHQFSGSIDKIDVSFPSLCLSNTALSYLCVSLSLSHWFSSSFLACWMK